MTTAQRLDALLGACNRLIGESSPWFSNMTIDEWNEFRATVQQISAEVGAEIIADQERRMSES